MRFQLQIHCFVLSMIFCSVSSAQDTQQNETASTEPPNMVGLVMQNAPRYMGSKDRSSQVLPLLQFRHQAFFIDSQKGIGYDLPASNGMYLEHSLGYELGRDDKKSSWRQGSDKLRGLGEINANLNTSIALGWQIRPWLIPEIKVTLPLTESQGSEFQASVSVVPLQTEKNTLLLQGVLLGADSRYVNTYFGVTPEQSAKSGFSTFHSSGGIIGSELNLNWIHQLNHNWSALAGVTYLNLSNKIKNSPIIEQHDQLIGNVGLAYNF